MSNIHHDSSITDLRSLSDQMAGADKAGEREKEIVSTFARDPDSLSMSALSVVLISTSSERLEVISGALSGPQAHIAEQVTGYPTTDYLAQIIDADYDVMVVDLDEDPERALDVVEGVCSANTSTTVMVFSNQAGPDLLVRCMRAGAREFLTEPIMPNTLAEAFVRASVRRQEVRARKKTVGKILVFAGAKGGSGVTTVAANFAIALAKVSGGKLAFADLNVQLGDAALTLGVTPKFSIVDALENLHRLDSDFLSTLLIKHTSGVSVLAAPDMISSAHPSSKGIEKLMRILREDFPFVVVDAGQSLGGMYGTLFELADTVYLISQVNVPELRNSNRLISRYFSGPNSGKLEIVLNRFTSRTIEIDENSINKALTRPAKWKLPNEYSAARRAQNSGTPITLEDSPMSRALFEMARALCGQPQQQVKKKKFGLFG